MHGKMEEYITFEIKYEISLDKSLHFNTKTTAHFVISFYQFALVDRRKYMYLSTTWNWYMQGHLNIPYLCRIGQVNIYYKCQKNRNTT